MSKRHTKMRTYASLLGAKVPYKVKYDSKKDPQVRLYQKGHLGNNSHCN